MFGVHVGTRLRTDLTAPKCVSFQLSLLYYRAFSQPLQKNNMEDAIRISEDRFRDTYATGFETWAQLYTAAKKTRRLPASCFFTQCTFPLHPTFPRNPSLTDCSGQFIATGYSDWNSSPAQCAHDIHSFRRLAQLNVTSKDPVSVSISKSAQDSCYSSSWFDSSSDYLAILMLAWTYILSARWTELMPAPCSLFYTDSMAKHHGEMTTHGVSQHPLFVDIGPAAPAEVRWWAAILAQGQGWQATMRSSSLSPWSIRVKSCPEFIISPEMTAVPSQGSASTFVEACGYLNRFCIRHNIVDQSHAALASVLLLPHMAGETLRIPSPSFIRHKNPFDDPPDYREVHSPIHWIHDGQLLDRLLTLSCNIRGIRPLLLSVFYEPSIECNAVTPWLQGTLAAIESLTEDDPLIFGRMCMERTPELACIWLGSTIIGLQKRLLQEVKYGQIPLDLHSAVWSGTVQSFIQQPVSQRLVVDGLVDRADECRLLFLCQSDSHTRLPVCQWKPFGKTSKDDVDLEVRVHEHCKGHQLQYQGFAWEFPHGNLSFHAPPQCVPQRQRQSSAQEPRCRFPIVWKALKRQNEVISENATRNVLSWLRSDGCAPREKDMFKHEWMTMSDSEDEEELMVETESIDGVEHSPHVEEWLSSVNQLYKDV